MANEFVAKNGLISQNNSTVTGSLIVTAGITGSLSGTASWANNFTSAPNYVLNSATSSFVTNPQTSSFVTNLQTSSFATTGSNNFIGTQIITGSLTVSGSSLTPVRIGNAFTLGTNNTYTSGEIKSLLANCDFLGPTGDTGTFNFYGGGAYNTGAGVTVGGNSNATYASVIAFWRNGFIQNGRFTSNGNLILGTGTTDTGFKLDVSGTTRLQGATTITGSLVASGSSHTIIGTLNATSSQAVSSSYALTASYALNAGSGGTVSTASLLVTASAVSNIITFTKGDASTFTVTVATGSGGGGAAFPFTGDASISGSLTVTGSAATQAPLHILSGSTSLLYVSSSVGIGTTSPANKLDVNGTGRFTGTLTTAGGTISSTILSNATQILAGSNTATNAVYRATNGGAPTTGQLAVDRGTTSPGDRTLHYDGVVDGLVFGAYNSNAPARTIARAGIQITNLTNTAGAESGDLTFLTQTGGTAMSEKMRIFGGGNVAIGTSTDGGFKLDVNGTARIQGATTISTGNLTLSSGNIITTGSAIILRSNLVATTTSQSYFQITGSIQQVQTASAQIYGVNITPTMIYTTGSQTNTVLRVTPTFSGSSAFSASQQNIIADFGATSVGTQFSVNDITSGSIYMVNDVSGLPIIEALSDWTVNMYNYPTKVFQKAGSAITISGSLTVFTGSAIEFQVTNTGVRMGNAITDTHNITGSVGITGSLIMSPSSSFVLPLTASASPRTGSAYWSGTFLYIYDGVQYRSASFA